MAEQKEQQQAHPHIRERVLANLEASRRARESHNDHGLNYAEHKFTSKNFDRLMEQRGKSKEEAREIKQSFNKWADKENKDPNMKQEVTAKHSRPEGERAYVYSNKDGRQASGNYVSPDKMNHADEAKKNLATPAYNQATQREAVNVHGDQVRGTVAPQKQFTEDAKKRGDNVERKGGGTQIYTNGGFASGAVKSVPGTKTEMKTSQESKSAAGQRKGGDTGKSKTDEFGVDLSKAEKSHNTSKEHTRGH